MSRTNSNSWNRTIESHKCKGQCSKTKRRQWRHEVFDNTCIHLLPSLEGDKNSSCLQTDWAFNCLLYRKLKHDVILCRALCRETWPWDTTYVWRETWIFVYLHVTCLDQSYFFVFCINYMRCININRLFCFHVHFPFQHAIRFTSVWPRITRVSRSTETSFRESCRPSSFLTYRGGCRTYSMFPIGTKFLWNYWTFKLMSIADILWKIWNLADLQCYTIITWNIVILVTWHLVILTHIVLPWNCFNSILFKKNNMTVLP